jgi:hypothetical protein
MLDVFSLQVLTWTANHGQFPSCPIIKISTLQATAVPVPKIQGLGFGAGLFDGLPASQLHMPIAPESCLHHETS